MTPPSPVVAVLTAKAARTLCYGALGIALPLHLAALGLEAAGIGLAVTAMLLGSALLTALIRRPAERFGPRAALTALALLTAVAALLLLLARTPWVVVLAATLGNVAVGTGETGPFLALEQVVVTRAVPAARRTDVLSVYNLTGYAAAAGGAAAVGLAPAWSVLAGAFLAAAAVQALA
ncbi:MAG TPA: MFS transporter, partial [Calidithermus sp.]|nr:MFS transporter [Calidithermus sp.]